MDSDSEGENFDDYVKIPRVAGSTNGVDNDENLVNMVGGLGSRKPKPKTQNSAQSTLLTSDSSLHNDRS